VRRRTPIRSLINDHKVAELLGISVRTVRKWRLEGEGPNYCKLGRCVRYDPQVVDEWIASQARSSTSDEPRTAV